MLFQLQLFTSIPCYSMLRPRIYLHVLHDVNDARI
jgi:hypothetical protein